MAKTLIILAFFFWATPQLLAQSQENKVVIEEYIRQSDNQKKAGITMVIVGSVSTVLGVLLLNETWYNENSTGTSLGFIMTLGGSASTLIGIPIVISSGVKARSAAELSLQAVRIQSPIGPRRMIKAFPSLGISIPIQ